MNHKAPRRALLSELLRDAQRTAGTTLYGDRVAIYMVELSDSLGLAVARAVHGSLGGASPTTLLERARERGVQEPNLITSAPVETLARVVVDLGKVVLGAELRAMHRAGGVPLLVVNADGGVVRELHRFLSEIEGEPACPRGDWFVTGWGQQRPMEA